MTATDPHMTYSEARSKLFYITIKSQGKMSRIGVIKSMKVSMGIFQHEYTSYLQEYPQIKYSKQRKEFVFDP